MLELCVVPAIIPQSLDHLRESVETLKDVASEIQIDVVDGVFTSEKSWPYREGDIAENIGSLAETLPKGLSYELDLMIAEPLKTIPLWLAECPKQIVLHIETFDNDADIARAVELIRASGTRVALAALNDTPLDRLLSFAPQIDGIQCMGIKEIGRQGNPFDERVRARVRMIREAYHALSIGVDGSVNRDTILSLKEAGANRFVAGSSLWSAPDPREAYRQLHDLVSAG